MLRRNKVYINCGFQRMYLNYECKYFQTSALSLLDSHSYGFSEGLCQCFCLAHFQGENFTSCYAGKWCICSQSLSHPYKYYNFFLSKTYGIKNCTKNCKRSNSHAIYIQNKHISYISFSGPNTFIIYSTSFSLKLSWLEIITHSNGGFPCARMTSYQNCPSSNFPIL